MRQLTSSVVAQQCPNRKYRIIFTDAFNDCIDDLPEIVTKITFGKMFNRPVDHLLQGLKTMFGDDFNHSVDHLPSRLTTLMFGKDFNPSIEHIPSTILRIRLHTSYSAEIPFAFVKQENPKPFSKDWDFEDWNLFVQRS